MRFAHPTDLSNSRQRSITCLEVASTLLLLNSLVSSPSPGLPKAIRCVPNADPGRCWTLRTRGTARPVHFTGSKGVVQWEKFMRMVG